jgi:hypothetical protein
MPAPAMLRPGLTVLAAAAVLVGAALPPGFEDVAWCPAGSCLRPSDIKPGHKGAKSSFVECYNEASGQSRAEIWTGSKSPVTVPDGWVKAEFCGEETTQVEELPAEYLDQLGVYGDYAEEEVDTLRENDELNPNLETDG